MKNPDALEWYRYADMDLQASKTLDEHTDPKPYAIICYHCQQCAEKMLKGFLVENNQHAPKTHDLIMLCNLCCEINEKFEIIYENCEYLDNFSVLPRYPNELEIIEADSNDALKYAEEIIEFFEYYNKTEL